MSRYGRRAVRYGVGRVCGGRTSNSFAAIPYESAISRECWSGDCKARLVPRTQLGSISGQRQAYNGYSFWSGRFMFPNISPGAIVPVVTQPMAAPAADPERQATLGE